MTPKPENKPIIAVDMDEVLFPMVPSLIDYVEREHSVKLTPEDFVNYDIEEIWPGGPLEGALVFEAYKRQIGMEIAPVIGVVDALGKLSVKHDIIVMTARAEDLSQHTRDWLNHHFPEVFRDVHILGNINESSAWTGKGEVCQRLGVSYLIDDHPKYIREVSALGITSLLFGDYVWNRHAEFPPNIIRVKDWREALEYFDGR